MVLPKLSCGPGNDGSYSNLICANCPLRSHKLCSLSSVNIKKTCLAGGRRNGGPQITGLEMPAQIQA